MNTAKRKDCFDMIGKAKKVLHIPNDEPLPDELEEQIYRLNEIVGIINDNEEYQLRSSQVLALLLLNREYEKP